MIELGEAPIIQVPRQKFGFCGRPDLAGKTFFKAFERELKQYSSEILRKALNGEFYFDSDGRLKGSNLPLNVLMNYKNLFPEGEHLLSIAEFGYAFNEEEKREGQDKNYRNAFSETYQDIGIIARTANDYFSENLIRQIKARGKTPTPAKPIVISNTDLIPRADRESRCGFVYKIKDRDGEELIVASAYGTAEPITKFTIYDERGIAIPSKDGKYPIWKYSSGVARVYSCDDQGAYSYDERLANSISVGRVVVGRPNVPQSLPNLEKHLQ